MSLYEIPSEELFEIIVEHYRQRGHSFDPVEIRVNPWGTFSIPAPPPDPDPLPYPGSDHLDVGKKYRVVKLLDNTNLEYLQKCVGEVGVCQAVHPSSNALRLLLPDGVIYPDRESCEWFSRIELEEVT